MRGNVQSPNYTSFAALVPSVSDNLQKYAHNSEVKKGYEILFFFMRFIGRSVSRTLSYFSF